MSRRTHPRVVKRASLDPSPLVVFVVVWWQVGIVRRRSLQPRLLNLIESTSLVPPMTTPPLTGSLSSPLVTAMADAPVRFMDGAAFDFFVIEMVNTLRASSAHAQARARKVEQEMIDAGLLPAPLPTPVTRKEHRGSTTSLASKATMKGDDDEEGLRLRLEAIGMHVGANITERCAHPFSSRPFHTITRIFRRLCHGKPYFSETLESIKFVCKDLWTACWDKQVDNLRTNHRVSLYWFLFLRQLSFRSRVCMYYKTIHSNLSPDCLHGMAARTRSSEPKWCDGL